MSLPLRLLDAIAHSILARIGEAEIGLCVRVDHLSRGNARELCMKLREAAGGDDVAAFVLAHRGQAEDDLEILPETAVEIGAAYDKAAGYCQSVQQYSVSPGNFAGGLTTIEEKSMGAFAKGGARPIQGVIRVAQAPPRPGLWLLDTVPDPHFMQFGYTNPNDTEGLMDLLSTGAQMILFITGRGSVTGSPLAPVIKITGNTRTYERMKDDMDFNAGRILGGDLTLDGAAQELESLVARVAGGEKSRPEALGHREYFLMYKHQDTPSLAGCCRA